MSNKIKKPPTKSRRKTAIEFIPEFPVKFDSREQAAKIQRFLLRLGFRFPAGEVVYPEAYGIDIQVTKEAGPLLVYTTRADVFRNGYGEKLATTPAYFEAAEALLSAVPPEECVNILYAMEPYRRHFFTAEDWRLQPDKEGFTLLTFSGFHEEPTGESYRSARIVYKFQTPKPVNNGRSERKASGVAAASY